MDHECEAPLPVTARCPACGVRDYTASALGIEIRTDRGPAFVVDCDSCLDRFEHGAPDPETAFSFIAKARRIGVRIDWIKPDDTCVIRIARAEMSPRNV